MKFPMGSSTLSVAGQKKVTVSLPKSIVEMMGLVAGQEVDIIGYSDPVEIVLKPREITGDSPQDLIESSLARRPWKVFDAED